MNAALYNNILPKNITELISQSGYTQETVARRAGLSQRVLRDILKGKRIIRPIHIACISNALGITPDEIFNTGFNSQINKRCG